MQAPIPPVIVPLLDEYRSALERELPGLVVGLYLHGSIALSAFRERSSDIDAAAVITRRCTPDDIEGLAAIHQRINQQHPRPFLEVIYLQPSDLGKDEAEIEPFPYAHDGGFVPSGHFEINAITWWVLKNWGITLMGTPAADLNFSVDWGKLIANMRVNLNDYWGSYTRDPRYIAMLFSDYGIQWAVTGVLRQYYSFREGGITSKDGAGIYALEHVPDQWHRLIQEALNLRSGTHQILYGSSVTRALDAFHFMKYIIGTCNSSPLG